MNETQTTEQFLANEIYIPGYMLLHNVNCQGDAGEFLFDLREPQLTRGVVNYVTPRGLHLCISQATYAMVEEMARRGKFPLNLQELREIALQGRLKIADLYQRFRKEIRLEEQLEGTFNLTRFRLGRIPILKFDFAFGDRAIIGNLTGAIAPNPVPQHNAEMLRN